MGGKVAMLVALRHPELVERLVVVDVAPVPYDHATEFDGYIDRDAGHRPRRRSSAAARRTTALREAVPDPTVRGFLLQSLRREGDGWRWLAQPRPARPRPRRDQRTGPRTRLAGTAPYDGPVLWVGGADSRYVAPEYVEAMDRWFPRNRRVTVKGAGHWVHSEQPRGLRRGAAAVPRLSGD